MLDAISYPAASAFHVSPEVQMYQKFLGPDTSPQQAEAFIHGMSQWINSVFAHYAQGEKKANDELKKAEQS